MLPKSRTNVGSTRTGLPTPTTVDPAHTGLADLPVPSGHRLSRTRARMTTRPFTQNKWQTHNVGLVHFVASAGLLFPRAAELGTRGLPLPHTPRRSRESREGGPCHRLAHRDERQTPRLAFRGRDNQTTFRRPTRRGPVSGPAPVDSSPPSLSRCRSPGPRMLRWKGPPVRMGLAHPSGGDHPST